MSNSLLQIEEWHARQIVMNAALRILDDKNPRTARQICNELSKIGLTIPKRLVNSIFFSEARRYVKYDRKNYTYRLRLVDGNKIDTALAKISSKESAALEKKKSSQEIRARYIGRNDLYSFLSYQSTSSAFFETVAKGRTIQVRLNENHPLCEKLSFLLADTRSSNGAEKDQRYIVAKEVFQIMLAAWAKYENELPDGPRKFKAEDSRLEWGRNARLLMLEFEDE